MEIISSIWHTAAYILGAIFLITGILSLILYGIEKGRLRRARVREDARLKTRTGSGTGKASEEPSVRRRIALITGASSGLGAGFTKAVDAHPENYDVTEIWLLARRADRLNALAGQIHLPARVLSIDMTDEQALQNLNKQLKTESDHGNFSISLLMNCAGFGKSGNSEDVGENSEAGMVRLNDEAAVKITQICLPYMKAGARIGEICSVAGFQPIPGLNAYSASKAFLYSYSRALRIELLRRGISVTAICPYWVSDTEFISVATGAPKHPFMSKTTISVVNWSLRDVRRRHAVSTPGLVTSLDRFFRGLIADSLLARICGLFSLK